MASSGATAAALAPDKPWNAAYVTQRSKALPKNSLFGSVLERLSDDDMRRAQAIDAAAYERQELDRRRTLKQAYDKKVPPHLVGRMTERTAELERHRANILEGEARLLEQEKAIDRVDEMARYFRLPPVERQQPPAQRTLTMAVPQLNLDLAREMNRLGVGDSSSYNRDKHRHRAPVHSYSHLGPPLERGMEFTHSATETAEQFVDPAAAAAAAAAEVTDGASGGKRRSNRDVGGGGGGGDDDSAAAGGGRTIYQQGEALVRAIERPQHAPAAPAAAGRALDPTLVPPNIRRSFGSKQFDLLFADETKTRALIDDLRRSREARRQSRRRVSAPTGGGADTPPATNYNDLSYVMRTDAFAGHSFYRPSLAKESYTKDVFERRYPDPEQFRHVRDAYGRWKEQELQRTRLLREYDERVASLPKHAREAAAAAVVERKPPPVAKAGKKPSRTKSKAAKSKGKPKPVDKENDPEPKIVFRTPPMSASTSADAVAQQQQQSAKVFVQEDFKRDDDFWDFYDSGN